MTVRKRYGESVLLGVLTASHEGDARRLGPQTISFKGLARVGRRAGVRVTILRAEDMDDRSRRLKGYEYDPVSDRWRRVMVPWPDVVYNRVARRSVERRDDVRRALQNLHEQGIPVFNPGFLDKWTMYRALSAHPSTANHLPEFRRVCSTDDVYEALKRRGALFLKPVGGSLGKGIVFVRRLRRGFLYHAYVSGHYRRGYRSSWSALRPVLEHYIGGRPYLVQVAIRRASLHGAPFDVRALVQKDTRGHWRVRGMAARVAARGRVLTHVPRGGSRYELERAVEAAFHDRACEGRVVVELTAVARRAAAAIDAFCPGIFGELSVDLTLDRHGRVWILECNAKPSRFDESPIRRRHLRGVIEFAREIARRRERESS